MVISLFYFRGTNVRHILKSTKNIRHQCRPCRDYIRFLPFACPLLAPLCPPHGLAARGWEGAAQRTGSKASAKSRDASKKNSNASRKNWDASRKNWDASRKNWDASRKNWDASSFYGKHSRGPPWPAPLPGLALGGVEGRGRLPGDRGCHALRVAVAVDQRG